MTHTWDAPIYADVDEIVALMERHYEIEINQFFQYNPSRLRYHLYQLILDQSFQINKEFLRVARQHGRIIAWSWLTRDKFTVYADQEMAVAEFIHINLELPVRQRIQLIREVLQDWITLCEANSIPVLCSTTIRMEQRAFMRIHEQLGFVVRGSFAYRRIM